MNPSPTTVAVLLTATEKGPWHTPRTFLVDEDGFGPSKLTQQIYSLPPLATRELVHIKLELVDGLEPPTC